jgi:hypothetical protein
MATLYESAGTGRKLLLGFVIFSILVIAWEGISRLFTSTPLNTIPQFSYYLPADLALKNVPPIIIEPIKISESVKPTYSIDRLSNALVAKFPDTAYVYKVEEPREKLTTVEDATETAAKMGFNSECIPEDEYFGTNPAADRCTYKEEEYTWVRASGTRTLKFNKTTQVWDLTTDYFNNIDVKTLGTLNSNLNDYINIGASIVNNLGFSNGSGLNNPYVEYIPADLNNAGAFFKPERDTQARFVFVEVYRNLLLAQPKTKNEIQQITTDKAIVDNIPPQLFGNVYGSDPRKGSVRLIVGNNGSKVERDVFSLDFTDFEYATRGTTKGVYPIINLTEAWTKAQTNKGFLVYLLPENGNPLETYTNLAVRSFIADATKTTLGYYEREEWNGFVSPIFIFEGRAVLEDGRQASFTIFVDALKRLES